ncbi:CDP-diacylglycerol-serine O-phosphatidyltransferase (phosphatidylserine synthase) [Legionella quinlivanii]|uniref:CDP-diacylglycerol--serine O-phosphatidyltransferase n=1 Tax=Legionella quinlivanii TaxID=45073 RepID=A0A0W0XSA0_9GAMM|nr:CDP-diacylglycerol--serine O-phosphatidyltransferase [Legionella quinlivanii]KTD47401.1 CDP-diacylglycerol-serine O-phosphatidyltransferase (phosphatidylserine synthase) [Legionella quinlivanii]MCW8451704.1 CDP-diacylglycerol--serine O-phosphatidyltransferase [Legionella quinlivanii]SEG38399.1 CDP-diacylglycerol---serine O-phosphatidyltransferase [Legionella quinlivanii DSM 21216]STY10040.1 CDP-diacylglycerol-serine O-phosphatidyltransferase (phosphatidylserine synthase) [Legionella quinliva
MNPKESHSGIYLLPNLFTTASLFAAFYSIVASLKNQYETAVIAIFIGMLADGLDGRIARLTNTQTAFGAQYDSLSDMVTFGVAPSLLVYSWGLDRLGKIGWLVAFVYTAAVALRLARFNTQVEVADKRYFQGLACPPAAAIVSSFVWLCFQNEFNHLSIVILTAAITVITAVLMVSNIRYHSFKEIDFKGKVPFLYLLITVILFVAIAANPSVVLFIGFVLYALSGPLQLLVSLHKKRRFEKQPPAE